MRWLVFAVAAMLVAVTPSSGARAALEVAPVASAVADGQTRALLLRATAKLKDGDTVGALPLIRRVLAAPDFDTLSSEDQHQALLEGGFAELKSGVPATSIQLLRRAVLSPEADYNDWLDLGAAGQAAKDSAAAVEAVTMLARRWPDRLSGAVDPVVSYALSVAPTEEENRQGRIDLLSALYDARWPQGHFSDGSYLWSDLAAMVYGAGDENRAADIATSVAIPRAIVGMCIGRDYDAILRKAPDVWDLAKRMEAYLAEVRERAAAQPDKLQAQHHLLDVLVQAGDDAEALKLADDDLAKAKGPHSPYTDGADWIEWVHNARSHALRDLGRSDEAVAAMRAGMALPEDGGVNISQVVNLADLLNALGRPKEALEVISHAGPGSAFGQMEILAVRGEAWAQLGDKERLSKAIAEARGRLKDAPSALEDILIAANDLDGAAALFVQRLGDKAMRWEALMDLQGWRDIGPSSPVKAELDRRFAAVRARPEVQAAVQPIGRILTIPFRKQE